MRNIIRLEKKLHIFRSPNIGSNWFSIAINVFGMYILNVYARVHLFLIKYITTIDNKWQEKNLMIKSSTAIL